MGLTLEEQIELLRTVAMLCARNSRESGGLGWIKAGQKWDAVRHRLEAEHADQLARQPPRRAGCEHPGCGEPGVGCWKCDPHPGHSRNG